MKKAAVTGFFTGVLISGLLICASFVRQWLPNTFTANLFFNAFFFISVVGVLWLSLNYYCRTSEVKWMTLNATGAISGLIAAAIVSLFSEPLGYSLYNFAELATALFLIAIFIAGIYYMRNRNRAQENVSKNQELIF